jgi:drug/metabolite transporter (DMT)-like permease
MIVPRRRLASLTVARRHDARRRERAEMTTTAVALALGAGLCLGVAAVLQQRIAGNAPSHRPLHPRLLTRYLIRRPLWLLGVAVAVGGYIAQAAALGTGRLTVVEPLLVTSLLFALPLGAAWARQRLRGREWFAAVLTVGGLATFLVLSHSSGGRPSAPAVDWAPAFGVLAFGLAAIVLVGHRIPPRGRAALLATVAGIAFGTSDALTKTTIALLASHHIAFLLTWEPYALVAVAFTGFMLQQNAYHAAHLTASLPATTVLEPFCGAMLGVFVLGERLTGGGVADIVEGLSIAAMVIGVVILARSPLVSGLRKALPHPAEAPSRG